MSLDAPYGPSRLPPRPIAGPGMPLQEAPKTCKYFSGGFDDDDPIGPVCGAPATHISCMPFIRTPTCAAHKCRCAKPLHREPNILATKEQLVAQALLMGKAIERLKAKLADRDEALIDSALTLEGAETEILRLRNESGPPVEAP